jgi:dTDP-4-dehydrorhamnose reductase
MIWLVGNRGMLGSDVERVLADSEAPFVATDQEVDITDKESVERFTRGKEIGWIINCAAYTDVDGAEREQDRAFSVNTRGACNIAAEAKKIGARVIHISTDYVFDGTKGDAYTEEDAPNPLGIYGKSKLEGENCIRDTIEEFYILRTSWLYGRNGTNFVLTMLRLFKERNSVEVVADQYGSPTWTLDLARVIMNVIGNENRRYGVYHYSGEGRTTWYGFACEILGQAGELGMIEKDIIISPVKTLKYRKEAKRPKYSYLSKAKIRSEFDVKVPDWEDSLKRFLGEMKKR